MNQHFAKHEFRTISIPIHIQGWQKRFIWVARCFPGLWFQTVLVRDVDGRREYRSTAEAEAQRSENLIW